MRPLNTHTRNEHTDPPAMFHGPKQITYQTQGKGVGKYAILVFYALQQIAVNLSLIEHISPHSSHGSDVWARFSYMLWKTVIKVSAKAQFSSGGSNGNPWTSKLNQFVRQIYSLVAVTARTSVSYSAPRSCLQSLPCQMDFNRIHTCSRQLVSSMSNAERGQVCWQGGVYIM